MKLRPRRYLLAVPDPLGGPERHYVQICRPDALTTTPVRAQAERFTHAEYERACAVLQALGVPRLPPANRVSPAN